MTKIAIVNDLHLGVRGDSSIFLDHQEKFFSQIFFPHIDENKIKIIFDLGDTFDRRKFVNFVTLDRVKRFFFDEIEKRGIQYHSIVGNHSVFYTNTNEINSMELLLSEYKNFFIYVDEPKLLEIDSTKFLMVPWLNKNNSEHSLSVIEKTKAQFVLGHFAIEGFEMMKGIVCDHGLKKEFFSRFEGVYSGHFHHPSEYGNIRYLGAQYEMNWSDHGGRRGFHVFDTTNRDLEFIANDNVIHHKLEYNDSDMTVENIESLDLSMLKDTFVKVIVKNRTNPYIFDLFLSKLNDSGAADVKTIEESISFTDESSDDEDQAKDTQQILHEYIDSIETDIDKQKIKRIIDNLYIEASAII